MKTAINLVFGLVVIAFGSWWILAGLYVLDVIDRHVPGHDIPRRLSPQSMRVSIESQGRLNILAGIGIVVLGVVFLAVAL